MRQERFDEEGEDKLINEENDEREEEEMLYQNNLANETVGRQRARPVSPSNVGRRVCQREDVEEESVSADGSSANHLAVDTCNSSNPSSLSMSRDNDHN